MASSGNFPVWTSNVKGATNLSKANTRFDGSTNSRSAVIPFHIPTGTKFYVECLVTQATNYNIVFGLVSPYQAIDTYLESQSSVNGMIFHGYSSGDWRTQALVNGSRQGFNALDDDSTANRVLAMTINRVDNEIKMYIDNTLITNGTISISATEDYTVFASFTGGTASGVHMNINCGHDSTGAGTFSAASNADENGFGEFQYSPPTGFLAICSPNIPTSTAIDPAETDDDISTKNFGAVTYTGNAGTNAISGVGFQPDLVWIKISNTASNGPLVDSSRGANKPIFSQVTNAEVTSADISSFDSDGFTLTGTGDYDANFNGNTNSYVAWCWRANGGTTSTNTSGTITSTVQANTAGGFSIVQYTGTGTNSTVGHGLSAAPEYMIIKNLDTTDNWINYNKAGGAANRGQLNTGNYGTSTTSFQSTDPSSTVITLGTSSGVNSSTHDFIAYCWHGVSGYSKFHVYKGNGNSDGPYVYTGFRPRLVSMIRSTGGSYNVFDSARYTYNPIDAYLQWTAHDAQTTGYPIDFLANGFKIRTSGTGINQNNVDFYYAAWGAVPFKYNNAF